MALSTKREAFRVDTIARGLDHQRTDYLRAYGNRVAASSTTFEAGMPVSLNTTGQIVVHPGTDTRPFGITKYNKKTSFTAMVSAEPIQFATSGGTATLKYTTLVDHGATANTGGLRITSDAAGVGTTYAETTDFTYVSSTGVVTHVGGGSIPTATTVYAWYMRTLTAAELLADGDNFWNKQDDVTIQGGKVTVIEGEATIFTTQYNASRAWAINDSVSPGDAATDYCGGLFDRTSDSTNTVVIGQVIQLPTADDPFLGIKYFG